MLQNLHVKNLALIEEVDVDFDKGLIVFTGETGAGKSLILGSVNVALGQKADKDMIRQGTDYSLVELSFFVTEQEAEKLKKMDIYMEDNHTVTVTRKISEGRSVSKINGETVNLNTLKKAMSLLVDIYGQHEHQSLLYPKKHLEILDQFAKEKIESYTAELKTQYRKYLELKKRLESMDLDEGKRARDLEFLEYEVNEILKAELKEDEDITLEKEFKRMSNSQNILQALGETYQEIGYDSPSGAGECIGRGIRSMSAVADMDEKIPELQNMLFELDELCRNLSAEIQEYHCNMEFDPQYAAEVSERLDLINHLKLKYGQSITEILSYAEEKQKEIDGLKNLDFEIEAVKTQIDETYRNMDALCKKISDIRKQEATVLAEKVIQSLNDLNFISVQFEISITRKEEITENGYDFVEFLISTNPGEPLKPLAKVASGGELSRIMLAMKSILASTEDVDTLIFDEIDTGISGKTAQKVAEKMAGISGKHQVICISHLSQIAAMADHHYLIEKNLENDRTVTNIKQLNRQQSIAEIVRINGGNEVTEASLKQATEMKEMAERTKSSLI
ncbi:MAG: DNA repair protein RecN [Eubacterium sp.]|nr:DNA repair protein RecN [Eubacterium sp.]